MTVTRSPVTSVLRFGAALLGAYAVTTMIGLSPSTDIDRHLAVLAGEAPPPEVDAQILPRTRFFIESEPGGAAVWVDDTAFGIAPVAMELSCGEVEVSVRAAGYVEWRRRVTCRVDGFVHVRATLAPAAPAPAPAPAPSPRAPGRKTKQGPVR